MTNRKPPFIRLLRLSGVASLLAAGLILAGEVADDEAEAGGLPFGDAAEDADAPVDSSAEDADAPVDSGGEDTEVPVSDNADGESAVDGVFEAAESPAEPAVPLAEAVTTAEGTAQPLRLLGEEVLPGTTARLTWTATELFEGVSVSTPVLVINGTEPGPTLCLTAAVHGDELNGIEMVRRVMHDIDPDRLAGALIGVPIVNVQGFRRGSRYLPDRRDLNRYFPGNPNGSAAARIANSFFVNVVSKCNALVDMHTGSFERANLPQIRADLRNPDVVTLTQGFGATVILHSTPGAGTLRYAATRAGVPTVTLEAGGPLELELSEVNHGVKGIETLISSLGMTKRRRMWGASEPVYYRSSWVRANSGGILLADVSLGSSVRRGDLLGTITDPMNNQRVEIRSPYSGRVIGMARNQVVMPGFAAFHVGIQTDQATPGPEVEGDDTTSGDAALSGNNKAYIDGMSE
ncbi:MAG: succinylglutamate desuccinylase/aspartoacylase family protein [Woeseiaceae bacterium]|nr:succinylglutamate desuccinylase/aspartoacylase family protein [Woeseiaceae bacterium]